MYVYCICTKQCKVKKFHSWHDSPNSPFPTHHLWCLAAPQRRFRCSQQGELRPSAMLKAPEEKR